jgi:alpha-L-rhamnosidase
MQGIFKKLSWIQTDCAKGRDDVVLYKKLFSAPKKVASAKLYATCCGTLYASLNGVRVSEPMAPGVDCYPYRMPYKVYDICNLISENNELCISVARGWYGWYRQEKLICEAQKRSLKAAVFITYCDGSTACISTDESWSVCQGKCIESDIYNGEYYDAGRDESAFNKVIETHLDIDGLLYLSDAEKLCEQERLSPVQAFITPKGEYVVDFGQNITGYIEFNVTAKKGEVIEISHCEELDKDGNFYTENYRKAKAKLVYVCKEGEQSYKPMHTFYGFRYIRLDKKPQGVSEDNFKAVVVHSNLRRTGYINTSDKLLNKLCENIIWGQRDNFFDIPTDCPQRDERLGWTGDAQVFCCAANYNFDCEKFYTHWLGMLKLEQKAYGFTPNIVPDVYGWKGFSSGWSDVAAILPWEVYLSYGNKSFLADMYPVMKRHVDSITESTTTPYLWTDGDQLGDWLALDSPEGSMQGGSDRDMIASAFYAYSTKLTVLAGKELGEDMSEYENLYENIVKTFRLRYPSPHTQTECVLTLAFGLAEDSKSVAELLVKKINDCGGHLQTGFLGTPYLLHALSRNGYGNLAYDLLLRREYPSWLYSVRCGATTVWEHWDGKKENGDFWSSEMNSFNHYAYGAVVDWIYGVAAGIIPLKPGYERIKIAPLATDRLDWLDVKYNSRQGEVCVKWSHNGGEVDYEIITPCETEIVIDGNSYTVGKGEYRFKGNVVKSDGEKCQRLGLHGLCG